MYLRARKFGNFLLEMSFNFLASRKCIDDIVTNSLRSCYITGLAPEAW